MGRHLSEHERACCQSDIYSDIGVAEHRHKRKMAYSKQGANVTVYATADQFSGTLYKSTDGGQTWTEMVAARGFADGQGFYDISVGVDPTNANNVYIGGQAGSLIFKRSTNGGTTFTSSVAGLHADVHAITVAPSNPNVIYHGNDGGIWKSVDGGTTWIDLNNSTFSATHTKELRCIPPTAISRSPARRIMVPRSCVAIRPSSGLILVMAAIRSSITMQTTRRT